MPVGRKPKPTALKLVMGNPGRRPPLVANEAAPPLSRPDPPAHLGDLAKVEWGRVIDRLFQCGLMTDIDVPMLAAYCDAYGQWVQLSRDLERMAAADPTTHGVMLRTTAGNFIQNPIVGALRVARTDMARYAVEFGMTPASRSRIDVGIGAGGGGALPAEGAGPESRFFGNS